MSPLVKTDHCRGLLLLPKLFFLRWNIIFKGHRESLSLEKVQGRSCRDEPRGGEFVTLFVTDMQTVRQWRYEYDWTSMEEVLSVASALAKLWIIHTLLLVASPTRLGLFLSFLVACHAFQSCKLTTFKIKGKKGAPGSFFFFCRGAVNLSLMSLNVYPSKVTQV